MFRPITSVLAALALAISIGGCATLNQLSSDVSTYSHWPSERRAGSYAFERLPSQQVDPAGQQVLENAARPAIAAAGFTPVDDVKRADFLVELGSRVSGDERASRFDDPFWWHGSMHFWRGGRGYWVGGPGPGFGPGWRTPLYVREVAVLIRDRKTGEALYEAHVSNSGTTPALDSLLPALFDAALKEFPLGDPKPHRVETEIRPT